MIFMKNYIYSWIYVSLALSLHPNHAPGQTNLALFTLLRLAAF